ncbi:MAG: hypothetical protein IKZ81_00335 [Clostridia bacterium]|nr:hypothetical protein [Clostridia bacterium]
MKKKAVIAAFIAVSAVFAAVSPFLTPTAPEPETASTEAPAGGYVLREYEGAIGVFASGSSVPVSVIDVDVRTLPEADRAALANGIFAADEDELNRRIEDYSS